MPPVVIQPYTKVPDWWQQVPEYKEFRPSTVKVLLYIHQRRDRKRNTGWATDASIRAATGVSIRSTVRAFAELAQAGLLTKRQFKTQMGWRRVYHMVTEEVVWRQLRLRLDMPTSYAQKAPAHSKSTSYAHPGVTPTPTRAQEALVSTSRESLLRTTSVSRLSDVLPKTLQQLTHANPLPT